MNKLHKIIFSLSALFVAICVLYGGAYAAGNETQFSAVKDSVSGEKLNVLGIVTDDEAAQDSAANITRAEFTTWTLRALNKTNSAAKESYFGDVPSDYWAAGYINLAYELGFVSGAENFEPAREITYDEAVKIAVAAVDYEAVAEINGGYPDGYRYAARQSGIIKNVSVTGTDGLTKAQAAVMIDNLLGTELINSYEYTHGGDAKTGETPLSKYFNVTIYRGIIEEVNVKDRQIRIITDGVSALYDVSDRVNINKVIEDDSEIYVQETDAEEKVIYIKQKGKANVMYDYITAVNKNYAADFGCSTSDISYISLKNADKEYRAGNNLTVYRNDVRCDGQNVYLVTAFAKVVINDDKIVKIEAYDLQEGGIIYRADEEKIKFIRGEINNNVIEGFDKADSVRIFIDGTEYGKMTDLWTDMVFDYWCSDDKKSFVISASTRSYERTLESSSTANLTLDGEVYDIDGRYGLYVWSNSRERYIKNASLSAYYGKKAKIFVDDNMCIRYIRITSDAEEINSFLGVIMSYSTDGSPDDEGSLKIYRITGGTGEKEFNVSDRIKKSSPISLEYARSVAHNKDGKGFFKFKLNSQNEIIKIEPVDMWGATTTLSGNIAKTNNYWINNLYVRNATIFAVFDDDGEFTVKILDWDTNLRETSVQSVTVISDYDPLYNPLPDYVMLTGNADQISYINNGEYVVTDIEYLDEDKVRISFLNKYGTEKYTAEKSYAESTGLKKNVFATIRNGYFGERKFKVVSVKDLSVDSSQWENDNASFVPESVNGFYKADAVLYGDKEVGQFMVNGVATDVMPLNEYFECYELIHGRTDKFVVKSNSTTPLAYAMNGDYNVWFSIYPWGPSPRSIGRVILEKK